MCKEMDILHDIFGTNRVPGAKVRATGIQPVSLMLFLALNRINL